MLEAGSNLSLAQLWAKEEEEMADLSMMGATEPVGVVEPVVTVEDIFEDLHPYGQRAVVASYGAAEREGVEPQSTVAEEFTMGGGQQEETHAKASLLGEHPTTPAATR